MKPSEANYDISNIDYYSGIKTASAIPEASSMIETFRAIGYSLETAVADIIDNSISANAKNIYFNSEWRGANSIITILDDGDGMDNDELIQAMRPGAQNPLSQRSEKDLGRFGLGLKTASFSQCRKLTVLSKKSGCTPTFWTWDLDYVQKTSRWELLHYIPDEFKNYLNNQNSGTIVIWSSIDRLISSKTLISDEKSKEKFLEQMDKIKHHISMTYHRFMEENLAQFYCWGHLVKPWNPFLINESATQSFPEDYIGGGAIMKGYVLPHKTHLTEDIYKEAEGINGWGAQQGFYVYRGKRLLLAGDWLGLFRKEEHYKLVRIQIDLPNSLDSEWQIDIKKSTARPPLVYKEQLRSYAKNVRNRGVEVFRHRGKILTSRKQQDFQPFWLEKKKNNKWSFVVNRDHLMIAEIKQMAVTNPRKAIEYLLRFIEETIPTKSIFIKESESGEDQTNPFENISIEIIKTMILQIRKSQMESGRTIEQLKLILSNTEPFNNFPELIDTIEDYD